MKKIIVSMFLILLLCSATHAENSTFNMSTRIMHVPVLEVGNQAFEAYFDASDPQAIQLKTLTPILSVDPSGIEGDWLFLYTITSVFTDQYRIDSEGGIIDLIYDFYHPTIENQGYEVLGGNYDYYVYGGDWSDICDAHFFFNYIEYTDSLEGIYVQTDPGGDPFDPLERPYPMTGDRLRERSNKVGTQADAQAEEYILYNEALELEGTWK